MQQYFKTDRPAVPRKYTIDKKQTDKTSTTGDPPRKPDVLMGTDGATMPSTSIYLITDSIADMFNTTNDINVKDSKPDLKRWRVMVGPPL
jgi:hypothetical protein